MARASNVLGLDWGEKRIGVAIARGGISMVFPYGILENNRDIWTRLKEITHQEQISLVVVGVPTGLQGGSTPQTKKAQEFGERAEAILGIEVMFEDERLSTRGAQALIDQSKVRTRDAPKDDIAAQLTLQSYLDRNPS